MSDRFLVEPEPGRRNSWRVIRIAPGGQRFPTPGRFRIERKAIAAAYAMEAAEDRRRFRTVYLGD
jgi:hypothetical protein